MDKMSTIDWVAYVLVVIGALNWGLAIFNFNLVELLAISWLIKTVYALVALSGLWMIYKALA